MIKIIEYIGKLCITYEDGQKIGEMIKKQINENGEVEISFENTQVVLSSFLTGAFGILFDGFLTKEQFNERVIIRDASQDTLSILDNVIENSWKYYSDREYAETVDKIISEKSLQD